MIYPKLFVLVGLPGAGKSFYANELLNEFDANIHSSDDIREEVLHDVNNQKHNGYVFQVLHNRIKEDLRHGKNCIYDATSISYKQRMAFLQELKNIPCKKICIVMATPYEICLKRNAFRDRKVPEEVIKRMYLKFDIPFWYEGWDNILIEYADKSENSFGRPQEWSESVIRFNQDNPHHILTLGEHCKAVSKYLMDNHGDTTLKYAGFLHDEGKVFTKAFIDSRGNPCETAHFYQHHCCGSYNSLFYEYPANHLYVAALIRWHMQPHFMDFEKFEEKYKPLLDDGESFYNDLMLLHKADIAAH